MRLAALNVVAVTSDALEMVTAPRGVPPPTTPPNVITLPVKPRVWALSIVVTPVLKLMSPDLATEELEVSMVTGAPNFTGPFKVTVLPLPAATLPVAPPLAARAPFRVISFNAVAEESMDMVPARPPVVPPPAAEPPVVVMAPTVITPLAVVMPTLPPAEPTPPLFAAPVVSRLPVKLTVPVPVALMAISPEAVPVLAPALVVIDLPPVRVTVVDGARFTLPPTVVTSLFMATVAVVRSNCVAPVVKATTPLSVVVPVPAV